MSLILADTSLWIEYLWHGHTGLSGYLNRGEVPGHPLMIGEIACGSLKDRSCRLGLLDSPPAARESTRDDARLLIEREQLVALGVGIIVTHLLASARLSGARLWTLDRRLYNAARKLKIAHVR
jgi:predicted nucleic acid-binding protein